MINTKKITIIEDHDWDNLVQETYGKPYYFQQQDGCKERGIINITIPTNHDDSRMNNSIPEIINGSKMGVKFDVWLACDPKEWNGKEEDSRFVNMFWERNFYPHINAVANDLHSKGLIEAGDYSIKIDW